MSVLLALLNVLLARADLTTVPLASMVQSQSRVLAQSLVVRTSSPSRECVLPALVAATDVKLPL